ncbi:MAG: hypothetical protein JWP85_2731 [Rhodoglobus sp.]|nr:hypothetical protein [Rhodoglobus sp.]
MSGMQHSCQNGLEIVIIVKGRHRFRWEVQDLKGKVYAHGEAVTVAAAKVEAGFARIVCRCHTFLASSSQASLQSISAGIAAGPIISGVDCRRSPTEAVQ